MLNDFWRASTLPLLFGLGVMPGGPAHAQAFYEQPQVFTLTQDCVATTSIRKASQPVPLDSGTHVVALGENRFPNGTHAYIELCGQRKWLDLKCGERLAAGEEGSGELPGEQNTGSQGDACPDFFDTIDNPIPGIGDITPPEPKLDAFDLAVMKLCGKPGKVVTRAEFQALLTTHLDVLERIEAFSNGRVYDNRPTPDSREAFVDDLSDAWFKIKAFDHILCGQPEAGGSIGGMHFHGRYKQLQDVGLACRVENLGTVEVVEGVIYTMPVRIRVDGGSAFHRIKGYGLTLDAEDLLKLVTRAFLENPTNSSGSTGCLLQVTDRHISEDRDVTFSTVFVRRASGIRTFYPDATPNGPGDRNNPACSAAIDLTD